MKLKKTDLEILRCIDSTGLVPWDLSVSELRRLETTLGLIEFKLCWELTDLGLFTLHDAGW